MNDLDDDDRRAILGEALMDQFKIMNEYLERIPVIEERLASLETSMGTIETDVKVIRAVLTGHNEELHNHEERITTLELLAGSTP